jgi:iron complex transport system permease protein
VVAVAFRLFAAPDGFGVPIDSIEWRLRSERILSGLAVGGSLAVAGVFLQALLRNPLAEPAILGLTSGAGLGVVVWIYLAYQATGAIVQYHAPIAPALLGSLGALAIVGALGQRRGLIDPITLILVGVVVSLICGAGILFIQYLMPDRGVAMASRWVMGALSDDIGMGWILAVAGLTVVSTAIGVWLGPAIDAATMSEDEARSVGVRLGALRTTLFLLAGALSAGSVLLAGPIGFVGLVCPHLGRILGGPSHRSLVVNSCILGGAVIVLADAGVRLVDLGAGRMPLGVLTALIGGPVFIAMLRREMRR